MYGQDVKTYMHDGDGNKRKGQSTDGGVNAAKHQAMLSTVTETRNSTVKAKTYTHFLGLFLLFTTIQAF
jgi:hypothetical protein